MDSSKIEIFNQVGEDIPELETVEKVLYSAIEKEGLEGINFNLIIVDNEYIHELNKNYRNIDRETDVITFALEDDDTIVFLEIFIYLLIKLEHKQKNMVILFYERYAF